MLHAPPSSPSDWRAMALEAVNKFPKLDHVEAAQHVQALKASGDANQQLRDPRQGG